MPQTQPKPNIHSLEHEVLGFETSAPPGSPSAGDSYLVGRGATESWYLKDDHIATLDAGGVWLFEAPTDGTRVRLAASADWLEYHAAERCWKATLELGVSKSGLTASTTQTQGQLQLAHEINTIAVCANTNDACTLPPARPGLTCVVANDGAQTLQAFPFADDAIDAGAADASTTVAAAKRRVFYAKDETTWVSVLGA